MENPSVTRFREYLRYPTVHPNPNYDGAIEWLEGQANDIGLEFNLLRFPPPNDFALWMTWIGQNPKLPSIILNSHIDVVPVDPSKWSHDPFGAEKDDQGNIYARGSQDMKCVGIQYLEAIRKLKSEGFVPLRTIHVTFVPDEEVGGEKGMGIFVDTPEFAALNVGFALDEGLANPDEYFNLYYGERVLWQIRFTATGTTGHGSLLPDNTAAEKIRHIINGMLTLRDEQKSLLASNPNFKLGDVTSINMTILEGGLQANVVPPELHVTFDIRITPKWNLDSFHQRLSDLCTHAGDGVTYKTIRKGFAKAVQPTSIDESSIWWTTFRDTIAQLNGKLRTLIFPAATDLRYIRQKGIPAFGFSPMNHTPVLLHDHDEYLNETIFLKGIDIYVSLIRQLSTVSGIK